MLKLSTLTLLLSFLPTFILADHHSSNWHGYLGSKRDGFAKGFQVPQSWPKNLQKKWQVPVGGGYGTAIIHQDRIYVHARQMGEEILHCLELKTGSTIWKKGIQTPFKMGGGGERHGKGPKSNPIYSDGRIFTMSITGILRAWDAKSGDKLWEKDYSKQFGKGHPYWGTATSPIVDGDRVIAHFGNCKKGALIALNVKTGKEVWTQGEDGTCYSSPLLVDIEGVRQIVECNHRALVGVESKTGKLLWEFPFPHIGTDQNMPTPTFNKGQILVGGENRGIMGVLPQLIDGKWKATKQWHQKKLALDMASTIMNDGLLYGFSHYDRGRLFCLDPKDGKVLWESPGRTGQNAMFLSIPGYVVALIDHGEVRLLKANREKYEVAAKYRVADGQTWAPPVLIQDQLMIKGLEDLTVWSFK